MKMKKKYCTPHIKPHELRDRDAILAGSSNIYNVNFGTFGSLDAKRSYVYSYDDEGEYE